MENTRCNNLKEYRCYLWTALACLLVWLFEPYVTGLFSKVADVLSVCDEEPVVIFVVASAIWLSVYCLIKTFGKKKQRVSHKQIAFVMFMVLVYLGYRFYQGAPFELLGFKVCSIRFAWLDCMAFPLLFWLLQVLLYKRNRDNNGEFSLLVHDKAIESAEFDILGYCDFVDDVLVDINGLNLSESYSVGLAGDWGQGKSSFLNLLKQKVEQQGDLCMVFSPRNSKSATTIQEDFFSLLCQTLSEYHTNLGNNFRRYTKALSIASGGWFGKAVSVWETLNVEDEKEAINKALKRIGKRLFVIVEDFDRLTAEEILEMLKVIDRNGKLFNTIYFTAYDKKYVNSVLSKYFGNSNTYDYSDKYFQFEYPLPPQKSADVATYLITRICGVAFDGNENQKNQLRSFFNSNKDLISSCVPTLRQAKRFSNLFLSRYLIVKEDVFFVDFFLLTLLKFSDADVYNALARLELVMPGVSNDRNKILELVDGVGAAVSELSGKTRSVELLQLMFPERVKVNNSSFNRIRWIDSFDLYFYGYSTGRVYSKELFQLFLENSDEDAFRRIDELLMKGQGAIVEGFLCSRQFNTLGGNPQHFYRLFKLLCYLDHKNGRSITVEGAISGFWEREVEKGFKSILKDNYKTVLLDVIHEMLSVTPVELGLLFKQDINSINENNSYQNDLVFNQEELIDLALAAQRCYYKWYGREGFSFNTAFVLATIEQKDLLTQVVEPAKIELLAFMRAHPEEFAAEMVVPRIVSVGGEDKLQLTFIPSFQLNLFFPVDGYKFEDWTKLLSDTTRYVISKITAFYRDGRSILRVKPIQNDYNKCDFDAFALALRNDSEMRLDEAILEIIQEGLLSDFQGLNERLNASEEDVKLSIRRLVNAKRIDSKYLSLL